MTSLRISLLIITMISMAEISAQESLAHSINWKIAAELPAGNARERAIGVAGPVAGIHNHVLILAGGANFPDSMPWDGGKKKYFDDVYVYELRKSSLHLLQRSQKLSSKIAYPASCSALSGIVYAGGENEKGISDEVFHLHWDKKTSSVVSTALPKLPIAVTNASAVSVGNNIYIAAGETSEGVSDQFLFLNLNDKALGWQKLPKIPQSVSHAVMVVQSNGINDCIYLIGGRRKNNNGISDLYTKVFEFDFSKMEWKEKQALPYALSAGTGAALGSNEILLFGGDKGKTFHETELLIAAINAEQDNSKKQELILQRNRIQSTHPGFSNEILRFNIKKNEWVLDGKIPYAVPVTTTAVKWNDCFLIPSGEIRAGVRSPYILSAKLVKRAK